MRSHESRAVGRRRRLLYHALGWTELEEEAVDVDGRR
jgi:hypothetical protein